MPKLGPYKKKQLDKGSKNKRPYSQDKKNGNAGVLVVMLKLLFEKQELNLYDPDTGMLHLTKLACCPDVESIKTSIDFNTAAFCDALVTVVKDVVKPSPSFLVVDENGMNSPQHFLKAIVNHELHTGVRGLSFAKNNIKNLDFLQTLTQFTALQEIVFEKNPVADLPDYRTSIRKRFPDLLGLDHEGINRPPLSLPWPVSPTYSDDDLSVLEWIELHYFRPVESGGSNNVVRAYLSDAAFSMTIDTNANIEPPKPSGEVHREVVREYVVLRSKQKDWNHNCVMKTSSTKVAQGLTDILSALSQCLYPSTMMVHHELDSRASISFLDHLDVPMVVATVHGRIQWLHKSTPDDTPVQRRFSRTFSLLKMNDNDGWQISNDQMMIQADADDVLFTGDSTSRMDRLSKLWLGFSNERGMFDAVVSVSNNDWDVKDAIDDMKTLSGDVLDECSSLVNGDVAMAVKVARIVGKFSVSPDAALSALNSVDFDLGSVESVLHA